MIVQAKVGGVDPPVAGHAEVEDHGVAAVGADQAELGAAAELGHGGPGEALAEAWRERPAQIGPPRLDAGQPPALEHAGQAADGGLDFGKLGHRPRYGEGAPSPLEAPR